MFIINTKFKTSLQFDLALVKNFIFMSCLEFNVNHSQVSLSLFIQVNLFEFYPLKLISIYSILVPIFYALHSMNVSAFKFIYFFG